MSDTVNLLVPADERFRAIGPNLAGKFCAAQGGSEADWAKDRRVDFVELKKQ